MNEKELLFDSSPIGADLSSILRAEEHELVLVEEVTDNPKYRLSGFMILRKPAPRRSEEGLRQ